jgi:hypothetical protein
MHGINGQIWDFAFNQRHIKRGSRKDFAGEFQFVFWDKGLPCFLLQQLNPFFLFFKIMLLY